MDQRRRRSGTGRSRCQVSGPGRSLHERRRRVRARIPGCARSVQSDLSHHGRRRTDRCIQSMEERPIRLRRYDRTFLNLVTAGMPALLERPPLIDRHDCLSGGVRVVRSVLFALRDDPVRHRPVGACVDAQLWAGFVGTAIRDQRHDLCLVGLDLRHLLPPGDCDQRQQHGGAHIRQQLCGCSRRGVSRGSTGCSERPVLGLHFAHSGSGEADRRRRSWRFHADRSGSGHDDGSILDVDRGGS